MATRRTIHLRWLLVIALAAMTGAPAVTTANARTADLTHQATAEPVKGKFQAFHGKLFTKRPGKKYPQNKSISYNGPKLTVQAANIGREAAEPTIAVLKDGSAFFAAGT